MQMGRLQTPIQGLNTSWLARCNATALLRAPLLESARTPKRSQGFSSGPFIQKMNGPFAFSALAPSSRLSALSQLRTAVAQQPACGLAGQSLSNVTATSRRRAPIPAFSQETSHTLPVPLSLEPLIHIDINFAAGRIGYDNDLAGGPNLRQSRSKVPL